MAMFIYLVILYSYAIQNNIKKLYNNKLDLKYLQNTEYLKTQKTHIQFQDNK